MADVLIVCVREDELQAKALADMFERAGFTVGGAPANDAALRSTGAGVIVWSQASIRSRPFLDAAQRVIDAEKAVVASLIDPPPPDSIGDAPAFPLNGWTGDPEDPALDPLYFAVDRMVHSQRAAVGVAPAQPAPSFQEPPSLRPPPAAPPRPSRLTEPYEPRPPASFQRPPRAPESPRDPLGSEAEHWRAIRDSRNPADFMDYLARYGADGAFAEVAELRLKQLTASSVAPPATSLRDAARAAEPPVRATPRRVEPPPPRVEPLQRRAEPPAPRRADPPPRREPAYTRDYDRPPPLADSEPVRSGALIRVLLVVLLLGGGALAAGLYFGDGSQTGSMFASQEPDESAVVPDPAAELSEPADFGVGGSETAEEPVELAAARPAPPRRETQLPTRREREAAAAAAALEQAVPAPQTSWAGANPASSGPVSLAAGGQNAGAPPVTSAPAPITVPPVVAAPTNTDASASPPRTPVRAATVQFAQRPSARRITELYPARPLRDGVGGRAELSCTVQGDLSLACAVATETPAGNGFGRAALAAASSYRARPTLSDGTAAVGERTRIGITFQPPQE